MLEVCEAFLSLLWQFGEITEATSHLYIVVSESSVIVMANFKVSEASFYLTMAVFPVQGNH